MNAVEDLDEVSHKEIRRWLLAQFPAPCSAPAGRVLHLVTFAGHAAVGHLLGALPARLLDTCTSGPVVDVFGLIASDAETPPVQRSATLRELTGSERTVPRVARLARLPVPLLPALQIAPDVLAAPSLAPYLRFGVVRAQPVIQPTGVTSRSSAHCVRGEIAESPCNLPEIA